MSRDAYDLVRQALTTLEFFEAAYASSEPYQVIRRQVIGYLRNRAESAAKSNYGDAKFLYNFADTLEESNKPGAYVPLTDKN